MFTWLRDALDFNSSIYLYTSFLDLIRFFEDNFLKSKAMIFRIIFKIVDNILNCRLDFVKWVIDWLIEFIKKVIFLFIFIFINE